MSATEHSPSGATVTVEAASTERALAEVTNRLGPDAVILDARKIRKGGVAGFFATELVRLEATAGRAETADSVGPTGPLHFDDSLRAALADGDEPNADQAPVVAVGPAVRDNSEPAVPDPVVSAPVEPGAWRLAGELRWDTHRLARLDVPSTILDAVSEVDPRDDLGWIAAISGAVAPWCRPLPRGTSMFVGAGAERLRSALHQGDDNGRAGESFGHLVVDQRGTWDATFGDDVLAVSWSRPAGAPTALRLAATMGLVLGYGMSEALGAPAVRLSAVDVALTLRDLAARS